MALSDNTKMLLARASTATLTTQLMKRGLRNTFMQGVRPLGPLDALLVGEAFTLRYIPAREDITTVASLGDPAHPQRRAIETIPAGSVLVVDCRGDTATAGIGAILVARLRQRGVAGFVCDGGVRDSKTAMGVGLPLFAAGPAAPPNVRRHHAVDFNLPIGCGDVAVFPGDIVIGDQDGVVVLPALIADEVAAAAAEQERLEEFLFEEICSGAPLLGTYPPNAETLSRYNDRTK